MILVPGEFQHTGDSASLYNCTLSPGWSIEEVATLRLALIKFGIGKWTDIVNSGCLAGKTPAQLNLQAQRLLGQQSTAEFMGLHLNPDLVRMENNKKDGPDVKRKNNCIVNSGNKLKKKEIQERLLLNEKLYGVPEEEWSKIVLPTMISKTVDAIKVENDRFMYDKMYAAYDTDCEDPLSEDEDTDDETTVVISDIDDVDALKNEYTRLREQLVDKFQKRVEISKQIKALQDNEDAKTTAVPSKKVRFEKKVSAPKEKMNKEPKDKASKKTKKSATKSEEMDEDEDEDLEGGDTCLCGGANTKDTNWIACDKCQGWFHWSCVEITEQVDDDFIWLCPMC